MRGGKFVLRKLLFTLLFGSDGLIQSLLDLILIRKQALKLYAQKVRLNYAVAQAMERFESKSVELSDVKLSYATAQTNLTKAYNLDLD